jgi:hypothetical protein
MGVKLAHALGAHVVAFTTSPAKVQDAYELGADEVVVSRHADEMAAHTRSFDFILNTVAAAHDLDAFTALLKRDGTMTLVGVPSTPHPSPSILNLIFGRKAIAGSVIGGIAETQAELHEAGDGVALRARVRARHGVLVVGEEMKGSRTRLREVLPEREREEAAVPEAPNLQGSRPAGSGIPFEAWRSWDRYGFIACPATKLRRTCSSLPILSFPLQPLSVCPKTY